MNRIKTDVLVIGGGAAGIRAAVEAASHGVDVTLVNNAPITASGSTFSRRSKGWGIQALIDDEMSTQPIEYFYNEIVSVGQGTCDPKLVRILVEESGARFKDLLSFGVQFKMTDTDRFLRAKGCFSQTDRAFITADFDNLQQSLLSILQQRRVRILTGTVIDLIVRDTVCGGAFIFDDKNGLATINAGATIIATGGGGAIYANHLCGDESVGDGYALAHRGGAKLSNMEFIQFMLGLKSRGESKFLPRHLLYQENSLVDGLGKPVLETCLPDATLRNNAVDLRQAHCPFSTCNVSVIIDQSVWQATQETGTVFWQPDPLQREITEVVHMAHAFNGGILIDAKAGSALSGLYAAGEAAAGPHGADRIGGCMMTATQVFGKRAGQYAARHARQMKPPTVAVQPPDSCPVIKPGETSTIEIEQLDRLKRTVKLAMDRYASVVRSQQGLETCRRILLGTACQLVSMEGATRDNYLRYIELRNMIDVAMQIVKSAIARKTSLGAHCRADGVTLSQKFTVTQKDFDNVAWHPSMKSTTEQLVA